MLAARHKVSFRHSARIRAAYLSLCWNKPKCSSSRNHEASPTYRYSHLISITTQADLWDEIEDISVLIAYILRNPYFRAPGSEATTGCTGARPENYTLSETKALYHCA